MATAFPLYGAIVGAAASLLVFIGLGFRERKSWLQKERLATYVEIVNLFGSGSFPDPKTCEQLGTFATRLRIIGPAAVVRHAVEVEVLAAELVRLRDPSSVIGDPDGVRRQGLLDSLNTANESFLLVCSQSVRWGRARPALCLLMRFGGKVAPVFKFSR